MPRILAHPAVVTAQPLAAVEAVLEAEAEARIERTRRSAFAAGRAAGRAEGVELATTANAAVVADLRTTVDEAVERAGRARAERDAAVLDLAFSIAAFVVDAVDASGVDDVAARIRAAMADVDDVELVAHVAAGRADELAAALAGQVEVEVDPSIDDGDARLVGRWSRCELTLRRRWELAREVLDAAG